MDSAAHLDALRTEGDGLAVAAAMALEAQVPSCPGWNAAELVGHTGRVHRWVTSVVRSRTQEPMRLRDAVVEVPAPEERIAWYRDGLHELHAILSASDLDSTIWTWTGHRPAHF